MDAPLQDRMVAVAGGAGELLSLDGFPRTMDWLERGIAGPASQKGLDIPPRQ